MKKSRLIAVFLTLAMMLSLCAAAAPEAEKDSQANSVKAAAQEVLSASAMNMWMYEDNDVTRGTIQELAATTAALSAPLKKLGLSTEEVSAFAEDISFLREKTEYFKTMREEQDIRRNDFQLHYFFDEPEIDGDRASLYVVESISFHYPELPDKLSEAINYYNMELVRVDGRWLVAGIAAEGDDFDEAYKGTGFTAANAEAYFAAAAERAAEDTNELVQEYGLAEVEEAEARATADGNVYYDYDSDNATAYAYTYVSQMLNEYNKWSDIPGTEKEKARTFWNQNFAEYHTNGDCQNFASQCVWAGFNGSNSKDQIYNAATNTYSPIMDKKGNYQWYGTIPGSGASITAWTGTNFALGFFNYVNYEMGSSSPDIIAATGTIGEGEDFSSVYSEFQLQGAVLHVNSSFGHAIVVTDVLGPKRNQIYYCAHTADKKNLSLADHSYSTCPIRYVIPRKVKVRSAPEVKITADLVRPIPVGTQLTVGGTTDVNCYNIVLNIQTPGGSNSTFSAQNTNSISQTYTFNQLDDSHGVYTITITAQKTSVSDPVVYVYTIRTY